MATSGSHNVSAKLVTNELPPELSAGGGFLMSSQPPPQSSRRCLYPLLGTRTPKTKNTLLVGAYKGGCDVLDMSERSKAALPLYRKGG